MADAKLTTGHKTTGGAKLTKWASEKSIIKMGNG
jgi:hypothetical protein